MSQRITLKVEIPNEKMAIHLGSLLCSIQAGIIILEKVDYKDGCLVVTSASVVGRARTVPVEVLVDAQKVISALEWKLSEQLKTINLLRIEKEVLQK